MVFRTIFAERSWVSIDVTLFTNYCATRGILHTNSNTTSIRLVWRGLSLRMHHNQVILV